MFRFQGIHSLQASQSHTNQVTHPQVAHIVQNSGACRPNPCTALRHMTTLNSHISTSKTHFGVPLVIKITKYRQPELKANQHERQWQPSLQCQQQYARGRAEPKPQAIPEKEITGEAVSSSHEANVYESVEHGIPFACKLRRCLYIIYYFQYCYAMAPTTAPRARRIKN